MNAIVLSFNLSDEENEKLRMLCAGAGAELRIVGSGLFGCRLDELVSGEAKSSSPCAGFDEPMLVFAELTQMQFDLLLNGLKLPGMPKVSLKAVLTQFNAEWSAVKLYGELCAEREAFRSGKTRV